LACNYAHILTDSDETSYYFIKRLEDAIDMQARYAALGDETEIVEVRPVYGPEGPPAPAEGRLYLGYDVISGDIPYVSDCLGWPYDASPGRVVSRSQLLWHYIEAHWLTKVNRYNLFDSFGLAQSFLECLEAWAECFPGYMDDPAGYTDIFYLQLVTHGPDGQPVPVLTDFDDGA
jgi:hypothetical protein